MGLEKRVINDLQENDIHDVYWYGGKLFFLNQWDETAIRKLMRDLYPSFEQDRIQAQEDSVQ